MKRNKLALALTATLGFGAVATSAYAVNISENGVGDYAYIPYFSVANGQNEFINVVNTSEKTVAAKIVFRRGTDSGEVRDFIIFLSPKDVWTGMIAPVLDAAGNVINAKLVTSDNSCTVPHKTNGWTQEAPGVYSTTFDNRFFGSNVSDASTNVLPNFGSQLVNKIAEGYVTVAHMGTSPASTDALNSVAYFTKHGANKIPRNCAVVDAGMAVPGSVEYNSIAGQFSNAANPLRVTAIMIDAKRNTAIGVPTTTLANSFDGSAFFPSGTLRPTEAEMSRKFAVFNSNEAKLYSGTAKNAEQAASLVLMSDSVYGTYDTTNGTQSSWVMTFPTKRAVMASGVDKSPFKDSVVQIAKTFFDNEEGVPGSAPPAVVTAPFSPYFAPPPVPGKAIPTLNNELNVLTFNKTNPLSSLLNTDAGLDAGFNNGWMQLGFLNSAPVSATGTVAGTTVTANGLPIIGFEYFENAGFSAANSLGFTKNFK